MQILQGAALVSSVSFVSGACTDGDGEPSETGARSDCSAQSDVRTWRARPLRPRWDPFASEYLVLSSNQFPSKADQLHLRTEMEVWAMEEDELGELVWTAELSAERSLLRAQLDDGHFVEGVEKLDPTRSHALRVRYQVQQSEDCRQWTAWSDPAIFRGDDQSPILFDESVIRDIHLELSDESWEKIDEQADPGECRPFERDYYAGDFRIEDAQGEQVFDHVGVRAKGGCGSAAHLDEKAAFKIKLDWDDPEIDGCPENRKLHGQKTLTLNNMVQDDSAVRERLGYWLYKQFDVPTPRVSHVRLFVNDEYWGLYLLVESIKRSFLERWFDSRWGMLYEGAYGCDVTPKAFDDPKNEHEWLEPESCYQRKFSDDACDGKPGKDADPKTFEPLRDMIERLDRGYEGEDFHPAIGELFDWQRFLSMWAVDTVIGNWDGYEWKIINNYRLYHDPSTDLWTFISTGIDYTFKRDVGIDDGRAHLVRRCMKDESCVRAYHARLLEVLDLFDAHDWPAHVESITEQIEADILADPRKDFKDEEWLEDVEVVLDYVEHTSKRLRKALRDAPQ